MVLLLANLALSVALTVCVLILRNSVVDYILAHENVRADQRETLRHTYSVSIWTRVAGNLVVSVVYAFLVRALLRGRRWAYRRVIFISLAGMVGLALVFITPYPVWMRVEQVLQIAVLAALLYFVTRPEVKAHCQDTTPRFRR